MRKLIIFSVFVTAVVTGIFLFVSYQASYSHGFASAEQRFEVRPGDDALSVGARLEEAGIVSSRFAFVWDLLRENRLHSLVAGEYALSGTLTIPEIAYLLAEGKVVPKDVKVVFPEGWTVRKMAARLTASGLPGDKFSYLVTHPLPEWRDKFDFLADLPKDASVEGYLFPDTYLFNPEASGQTIIETMLRTFGKKVDVDLRKNLAVKQGSLFAAVTLASIVENEVPTERDRKIVADLFSRRLSTGMPLQSCATLQYILGVDKKQYSYDETHTVSPYNTYLNKGLPKGPVGNPGLMSLRAVAVPEPNPYFYFLSDPKTGETIFSATYDEHVAAKAAHGL